MRTLYADPCVLVGGAPRSGTTLVGLILAAHPQAAVLLEDRLTTIVRSVEALASVRLASEDGARTQRFGRPVSFVGSSLAPADLDRLAEFEGYRRCFAGVLRSVFSTACERTAPRLIGSKLPIGAEWEDVDHLSDVLADLRLIFVVRNPLDVIASSLARRAATRRGDDQWHIQTVEAAHAEWSGAMRTIARQMRTPERRSYVLKYEDLCATPDAVSARLFAFLNLPPPLSPFGVRDRPRDIRAAIGDSREAEYLTHHFDGVDALWANASAETLVETFAETTPRVRFGERIAFDEAAAPLLCEGFCLAEPWGRWTNGARARLRVRHPPTDGDLTFVIELALAHRPSGHAGAPVRLRLNGGAPWEDSARAPGLLNVTFPRCELDKNGVAELEIEILHPKPIDVEPIDDLRRLGIGVAAITLQSIASAGP